MAHARERFWIGYFALGALYSARTGHWVPAFLALLALCVAVRDLHRLPDKYRA